MVEESSKIPVQAGGDGQPRLDYEVQDDPGKRVALVRLKGRIDVFNYLQLSGALGDVAGDRQGLSLVLDLSDVVFIASSGWSVLLGVRSRLKRNQSKLVLVGMPPHLERIYQAMKLPVLIPAYPSLAEAEAALAQG
jgi:anti-anti-sigma factor